MRFSQPGTLAGSAIIGLCGCGRELQLVIGVGCEGKQGIDSVDSRFSLLWLARGDHVRF